MRLFSLLLVGAAVLAAGPGRAQTLWSDVSPSSLGPSDAPTLPQSFRTVHLDRDAMADRLASSPVAAAPADVQRGIAIPIPLPEGGFIEVRVAESSIMAPALQARYPEIRTYLAQGPGSVHGRLSLTQKGFAGMLFTTEGAVYVDPYLRDGSSIYMVYRAQDLVVDPRLRGRLDDVVEHGRHADVAPAANATNGDFLRTYRLAVAATGEYTQFHGGTVADGMAAIVTSMNRVAGVYERDIAVTFSLVANNDAVVFTNGATDPYSNSNGSAMLSQNQATLDAVIGTANYDIGHVFSTGGGGVAYLGSVCDVTIKAGGVTGGSSPVGDAFDIDYVAHEMGHQFGANHTQNNSCNRVSSAAYEPGSASTIMGYAGICPPNLQNNSDPYFHVISLDEMTAFITSGGGATCGTATPTGNTIPTVSATGGYTIPAGTPFTLTGSATDDTPGSLTYTWEEFDLGPAGPPGNGTAPFFRSFNPTTEPVRTFPQFDRYVAGLPTVVGEDLPTTTRSLTFRLTARDNAPGAGAIDDATITINTDASGGAFTVTFASTPGLTYSPGPNTVTWNVAGTDGGAVNTPTVDILISTDGGDTFTPLASGTANDGSEVVSFPSVETTEARVLVRAVGNIFFNVNPEPFTISGLDPPAIAVSPSAIDETLAPGGMTTEAVTISNTASAGAQDLAWALSVVTDFSLLPGAFAPARDLPKGSDAADGTGDGAFTAGGPDAYGYVWSDSDEPGGPAVDFQDISGTGTAVSFTPTGTFPGGDEGYADVALPFTFPFYGVDKSSIRVYSNGFATFSSTVGNSYTNPAGFPGASSPTDIDDVIAPFWDDLDQSSGGAVYTGTLSDGRFVVQWDGVPEYGSAGSSLTFQILLSADGAIEFQYGTMTGTLNSNSVGLENADASIGLEVAANETYVASNKAVRFTVPTVWITASPTSGSVAPGASGGFDVDLDASELEEGTYTASLVITSNDPTTPSVTVPVTLTVGEDDGTISIVVEGSRGMRYLGAPAVGVTVDDLAAQNLVRGVPGYYPAADPPNLWTAYDAVGAEWVVSAGTGEALEPGRAFRWRMYDRNVGNPDVSRSVELPFTLSTALPANTADVTVALQTGGSRFNYLANPFGEPLDVTGVFGWPGGDNVAPGFGVEVYDELAAAWVAPTGPVQPWEAFRVRAKGPTVSGDPRTLTIPYPAAPSAGPSARGAAAALAAVDREHGIARLPFTVSGRSADGGPLAASFAVAFADGARAALDEADAPATAPLAGAALTAGARVGGRLLAVDARPFAPGEVPVALDARGAERSLTLRWDASALPAGLPVVLVDLATGTEVDVRTRSSYTFDVAPRAAWTEAELDGAGELADASRATDRLVLRVGAVLSDAEAIEAVELTAVAPNPSSSTARVAFAVPASGRARVSVVDVRGREVAVLVDGPVEAGRHEAVLESAGLAAGVYLVRLESGGQVVTRQAAVVR